MDPEMLRWRLALQSQLWTTCWTTTWKTNPAARPEKGCKKICAVQPAPISALPGELSTSDAIGSYKPFRTLTNILAGTRAPAARKGPSSP